MRSRRILVLGAGPAQLGLLEAARVRGFHVVAVDRDPGAPGFRFAHERALIPSFDDEEAIERLAATQRIEGVIAPGIDYPVAVAARIAERLGLPHPFGAATALLVTSKLLQRGRFAEAGIPQPRFRVCAGLEDAREAIRGLGLPCIVKPPDQQGQRGLGVVRSASELTAAFEHALETARGSVVLVEELVEGREVTVNAFSAGGRFQPLTVTDRVVADPPAFGVALAHIWPSELGAGDVAAAIEVARTAAKALGVRDGPTYTQVLIGTEGPRIGELAARLGGGHDAELCKAALGVDLNGLALAAAVGESIPNERLRPRSEAGGACVRFLVPPAGTLESVEGVEAAEARDGVLWVHVYRRPGHTFGTLRHGSDRAGALLAVGETREQALVRADDALECVQLVTTTAQTEALR